MTNVVMEQLRHLGGTLGQLRVRVRAAVAGEVGRAVADAVREVVGLALSGFRPGRTRRTGRTRHPSTAGPGPGRRPGRAGGRSR